MTPGEVRANLGAALALSLEVLEAVSARGQESSDVPRMWLAAATRAHSAGAPWTFFREHGLLRPLERHALMMDRTLSPAFEWVVKGLVAVRHLRRHRWGYHYGLEDYLADMVYAVRSLGEDERAARAYIRARFIALGGKP